MITLAPAAVQSPALAAPPSLLATTAPSPTMDSNMFPFLPTASHGPTLFPALSPPTSQAPHRLPTTTAPATSPRACLLHCCPQTTPAHPASAPLATDTRTLSRWSMRMLTLTTPDTASATLQCNPFPPTLTWLSSSSPPGTCIPSTTPRLSPRSTEGPKSAGCLLAGTRPDYSAGLPLR
jgi:hypothetical protein